MSTHIALLRGINVGGRHKLPMKTLAAMFADAGCGDVRTYIQSGNVVFESTRALAKRLPSLVDAAVFAQLGFHVPIVIRTAQALLDISTDNPYLASVEDPKHLHVGFLAAKPSAARVSALDPERSPPDEFTVQGREVYLCCPRGLARTKLTNAWFDSQLDAMITVRNWRTVLKLVDMARH